MFGKAVRLFILLNIIVYSQSVEFRNYSVQDGLSNNKVNCVLQDKAGFIWFGTEDGLNRFDGYEFKVFRPSSEKNSIVSKDIWSLYEDEEGNIWIGSKNGDVIKFDYLTQKFSSWKIEEITRNDNSVTAIYVDRKKNVWVGTYQQGLFKFDQSGKKNGHWDYNPENPLSISNNFITSILEDKNDALWITTYFGLNEFNPEKPEKGFTKYFDFNTDKCAKEMFLSRSQLYRKLNSLTNQSPGEFIRTVKLKKAAKLLIEKKLSITQIALEIGFNSPSHFTKAFKQMFDCLPSEFVNALVGLTIDRDNNKVGKSDMANGNLIC